MGHQKELSKYENGLDIKFEEEVVEYSHEWVNKELEKTTPSLSLPKYVFDTLENGWLSTLRSRFDLFDAGSFIERLIIAAVIPIGEASGSNCFGTSLYLAGLIPSDILIDSNTDVGKGCPGIEDYLKRLVRIDSLESNTLIAYYDKGKICHFVYWQEERREFFDRSGLWGSLRGYKSLPKSDSLEIVLFDASIFTDFNDLFPLSLQDARKCMAKFT